MLAPRAHTLADAPMLSMTDSGQVEAPHARLSSNESGRRGLSRCAISRAEKSKAEQDATSVPHQQRVDTSGGSSGSWAGQDQAGPSLTSREWTLPTRSPRQGRGS